MCPRPTPSGSLPRGSCREEPADVLVRSLTPEECATLALMFRFSASQIRTFRACPRKWYFTSVMGLKSDPGAGAALGTEIHSQLENWMLSKTLPTHDAAIALLPLLPHPHKSMLVEHEFNLLTKAGLARGFIDLYLPHCADVVRPEHLRAFEDKLPLVTDYKTTSRLDYALTEAELEDDPQAILYGLEARRYAKTLEDVVLAWVYTQTKGRRAVKPVVVRQTQSMFEDGFLKVLDNAHKMSSLAECEVASDVPFDTAECDSFGGCPHRNRCPAFTARVIGLSTKDLLESLDTPTGGVYSADTEQENDMGFLEELAKKANAPFNVPAEAAEPEPEPDAPSPPPSPSTPEAAITPEPPEMPPIQVVTAGTSSVLPPEVVRQKRPRRHKDDETLSVEALVRQALTAAIETDNLQAMATLSALLIKLSPKAT